MEGGDQREQKREKSNVRKPRTRSSRGPASADPPETKAFQRQRQGHKSHKDPQEPLRAKKSRESFLFGLDAMRGQEHDDAHWPAVGGDADNPSPDSTVAYLSLLPRSPHSKKT